MSSYTASARLSNLEGDASDLQTAVYALSANKQNKLNPGIIPASETNSGNILSSTTNKVRGLN